MSIQDRSRSSAAGDCGHRIGIPASQRLPLEQEPRRESFGVGVYPFINGGDLHPVPRRHLLGVGDDRYGFVEASEVHRAQLVF